MRVYLSGPMSGYPEFNEPRFRELAAELRRKGHHVIDPSELGRGPWAWCVGRDLLLILWRRYTGELDAIVTHGLWARSRGARLEVWLGRRLGLPIRPVQDLLYPPSRYRRGELDERNVEGL